MAPRWMASVALTTTAMIVLCAAFAWLLSLHPTAAGRVYAAYGGVYIGVAIVWLSKKILGGTAGAEEGSNSFSFM